MRWHAQDKTSVLKELDTTNNGLSNKEVQTRLSKYGKNIIEQEKKKSLLLLFLSQLNSLLIYILFTAVLISFILEHYIDAVVIGSIIFINAIIGFVQEYKAGAIIEKLRRSLQYKAVVLRQGTHQEVNSQDLVPGDIILFETGSKIPADCRILESENLSTNEAVLTGESFPIKKNTKTLNLKAILAERANMLYAGTIIVGGRGKAVVVATGEQTEFGHLAKLVKTTKDEKMPLEKKLDKFSRNISIAVLALVTILFFIGRARGIDNITMFLTSVSLAVSAIPEGLPAIIAISLAVAIKHMHKVNVLVRKLPAAETLGRATVICTDKTGTLTEERLSVDSIYTNNKLLHISENTKKKREFDALINIGLLCNDAKDIEEKIIGDPIEAAIIAFAKKLGYSKKQEVEKNKRIKEYPFDSKRKMMSIIRKNGRVNTSYVKGAPGTILEHCNKELINGKVKLLSKKRRKEIEQISKEMQSSGLRVLGFAMKQVSRTISQRQAEEGLTFVGFTGMIDPPRKEVKLSVQEALQAGINIKIITGDAALTTSAIAEKVGIKGEIIEGKELEELPKHQWDQVVKTKTIFARVTPEQKLNIVETLKKQQETVAVTGDGVNDILALKRADIGVAMGVRGSDVARDTADIVLLDDNFASIIKAVKQGRRVFDNIKKSITFLLAANLGEVLILFWAIMLNLPLPFLPLAILWINLVTDSLPALALSLEPAGKNTMKRAPRKEGLFKGIWAWILLAGVLGFVSTAMLFHTALQHYSLEVARTMAVTAIVFFELFFAFSCKTKETLFKTNPFNNKWLIYAVIISAGIHLLAIYTSLGNVFGFVTLNKTQLLTSILVSTNGLIIFEGWKLTRKLFVKK